jgi:hypothetical protein
MDIVGHATLLQEEHVKSSTVVIVEEGMPKTSFQSPFLLLNGCVFVRKPD